MLIKTLFWLVDQLTDYFIGTHPPEETWLKNAPITVLVEHTILYSNDILFESGIKYFPSFKIYYYRHKVYFGKFNGKVVIYTKNHEDVVDLINTILHEVCHYIQEQTDTDFKNYKIYTKQLGDYNNPFEVEARNFVDEHLDNCLLYLAEKGLLRRA